MKPESGTQRLGPEKGWMFVAEPNSKWTQTSGDATKAVQNTVFNTNGKAVGPLTLNVMVRLLRVTATLSHHENWGLSTLPLEPHPTDKVPSEWKRLLRTLNQRKSEVRMKRLDETAISAFMTRFSDFYDGVVKKVELSINQSCPICEVVIEAQDSESKSGWAKVSIRVEDCSRFRFEQWRSTFEVLSSGIQIFWRDGAAFLFLDAYPDDPGMPNLEKNIAFVVGRRVDWTAEPV